MWRDSHKQQLWKCTFCFCTIHLILEFTSFYLKQTYFKLSKEMTPQRTYRRHYGGPEHATYHMLEYTAIFPSWSAAMHERLKHLHQISWLSQSSLVTHRQSESKFHQRSMVVLWLPGCWSQWEGWQSVGLLLMEQFSALVGTWQRNVRVWGWMCAVKGLRGPQCLPTGETEALWCYKGV